MNETSRDTAGYNTNIHVIFTNTMSVFDLLKNEGHDRTTLVVQCLICKTVSGTRQTGGKG